MKRIDVSVTRTTYTEFQLHVRWDWDLSTGNPAKPVLRALLEQPYGINRVEMHRYDAQLFGLPRIASYLGAARDLGELLVEDLELPDALGEPYEVWVERLQVLRRSNHP